jgi:hypothetical protein
MLMMAFDGEYGDGGVIRRVDRDSGSFALLMMGNSVCG